MTQRLVWWQAYKAALAGGHSNPRIMADQAVLDYIQAVNKPGATKVLS